MRELLAIANALADITRLRLFLSLREHELCVCQLVEFIGFADSTVSKHMSILREAGLVEARKCGRWVYYRTAGENASPLVRQMIDLAHGQIGDDPAIARDQARIVELIRKDDGSKCVPETMVCSRGVSDPVEQLA